MVKESSGEPHYLNRSARILVVTLQPGHPDDEIVKAHI
jgi:hypothetical protein